MSLDVFLMVDGIGVESRDRAHAGQIDVLSFSWGAANAGSGGGAGGGGGGAGAGKPQFQTLNVVKRIDAASPKLFLACASGQHIKQCVLAARGASGGGDFLSVKLEDCQVASIGDSGSHEAGTTQEAVAINFARITVEYRPQRPDGSPGTPVAAGWDMKANKPI